MRFLTRSLLGLFMLTLSLGLLAVAANTMIRAYQAQSTGGRPQPQQRERVFTVEVMQVRATTRVPEIVSFGEVVSGRTLELRAASGGEIVALSDNFREGGFVTRGEMLYQTDPANAQSRVALARNELAELQDDLADARRQIALAAEEVKAAESQLDLRRRAMERQDNLRDRGVGTDAAMETAELAVSSAEQALLTKKLSLANVQARISRTQTLLERGRINVQEAERLLAETTVRAEFDGTLSDVTAVLGRLVNAGEKLGNLIDPDALEVAFRVSSEEFRALMLAPEGLPAARVSINLGGGITFDGRIDRVSAAVGEGKTGREIFAALGQGAMLTIRPGDFVTVRVSEPPLDGVALVPASAASSSGEVLLIGPDSRLEAAQVTILRKQGDDILIDTDGIVGRQLVLARAPQLGAGIKVQTRSQGSPALEDREVIRLDPDRRARLLAALRAQADLPDRVRSRMASALERDEVPKKLVDRLEAGALPDGGQPAAPAGIPGGVAAATTEETITIPDDQRERMIAFIRSNDRLSEDRKSQILDLLSRDRLPRSMVERITQRMGG